MNIIKRFNAKYLPLLFIISVPFALFMNLQNANVVTVRADYPTHVVAGMSFPVTVTIDKGNLTGFGRYTATLPEGFTATSDLQNFEFVDNTIKILWVNIPYSNSFTFTFNVFVPITFSGEFTMNGKFGYVVDNERRFAELIPNNITAINDPLALRKAQALQNAQNEPVNINDISGYRTVNIMNNEAIVSIRINKANIKSMCKIEEMLPEGYVFHAIDRESSDFSSFRNIARFMWLQAPQKNIFFVSYKVIPNPGYSIKDLYINGAFSFIDNGNTYSVTILEKDLQAISESSGKPAFESNLNDTYNPNLNSELSQSNTVATNPKSVNYSSKADYDINSKNIGTDLNSSQPSNQNQNNSNSQINVTPRVVTNNSQSNDVQELSNDLKSKNYNQNQIDFFTSSSISSTPEPYQNTPSYSDEVGTNLNQSKSTQIPSNTQTSVNINAIPAPTTYFPSQQYNEEDPDNISPTLNSSYNRDMENPGLIGTNPTNQSVTPYQPKQASTATTQPTNPTVTTQPNNKQQLAQPSTPKVTTQDYSASSSYNVNQNKTTTQTPNNQPTNSLQPKTVTTQPTSNVATTNNSIPKNTTTTKPTSTQPSQTEISNFENQINIPAPIVQQSNSQTSKNSAITEVAQATPNITKYPSTTQPTTTSNISGQPTASNNQTQGVQTLQPKTNSTPITPSQTGVQANSTSSAQPGVQSQQNYVQTKTIYPSQPGTTQTTNQNNVTIQPGVSVQTKTITPTQTNTTKIATQNIATTQTNTQTPQNSVTNKTSTPTQPGTIKVPTQTITPNQTNSSIPTSTVENEKYITYNNTPNTQSIIKDENHNRLDVTIPRDENAPRLSNKDDFSQNVTKITEINEPTGKSNVYFRVQISAGHKIVNTKYYFKRLNIRDNVIVEQIAGWYKYTIQKFETYITARNQRNNIWNESTLKDAFVVAYNGRKRITVQEALMITNQKWVQ